MSRRRVESQGFAAEAGVPSCRRVRSRSGFFGIPINKKLSSIKKNIDSYQIKHQFVSKNTICLPLSWSSGPLVLWSLGPLVLGSVLSRQDALRGFGNLLLEIRRNVAPATQSALRGSQSAALPRNVHFEVHKSLRGSQWQAQLLYVVFDINSFSI